MDTTIEKAWGIMDKYGIPTGEKITVKTTFQNEYKDEYPFIQAKHEKGNIKYYFSEIDQIKSLAFETEKEVILANAIFENVKDKFEMNEFIQMLKFTFRILKVDSRWV